MNTKYFKNIDCVETLKKQYHKLAKENHPDLGGDTKTMQEINAEYEILFKRFRNIHKSANGSTYEKAAETNSETADKYTDIINQIINLNCDIEIIGSWIWCFNAYSCKDALKNLGFHYANRKKAWYWHTPEASSRNRKFMTMEEIRDLHGFRSIKKAEDQEAQKALEKAI